LPDSPAIDQILSAAAIGPAGVFLIGPQMRRISFAAQQHRALNLVWAIHERGLIKPGDQVAVVGGGFSGLTAATALSGLNCVVSLFERDKTLMYVERHRLRYVHPSIMQWPEEKPSITPRFHSSTGPPTSCRRYGNQRP
jgi:hypothetical protein